MEKDTSKYLLLAAAIFAFGGYMLLRREDSSIPTLLGEKIYYPELDMLNNSKLPRGYRNNNPLNIDYYNAYGQRANDWKGQIGVEPEGRFSQFRDLVYGYRAALVLLRGKGYINGGNDTIRKMISKFAPNNENYTDGYITNVSRMTGINPDEQISRNDRDKLTRIVYAMSIFENGTKDKDGNDIQSTYGLPNMDIINEAWEII